MSSWETMSWEKAILPSRLKRTIDKFREEKKTIVTLNGSFDIMHAGHLHILHEASKQGDIFIVALNTDRSIRENKGSNRPVIPLEYRIQMMTAISFVTHVTWFDEANPIELLKIIKPEVHVNGAEYGENCIEADTVRENGGRVHIVELVPGLSTTEIVKKIRNMA